MEILFAQALEWLRLIVEAAAALWIIMRTEAAFHASPRPAQA